MNQCKGGERMENKKTENKAITISNKAIEISESILKDFDEVEAMAILEIIKVLVKNDSYINDSIFSHKSYKKLKNK